jgi:hypothetical protein
MGASVVGVTVVGMAVGASVGAVVSAVGPVVGATVVGPSVVGLTVVGLTVVGVEVGCGVSHGVGDEDAVPITDTRPVGQAEQLVAAAPE